MLLLAGSVVHAQTGGSAPEAAGEMPFQRGTVEVGGIVGATLPVSWLRAHSDRRITMASLDVGRVMTDEIDLGPLSGHFELLLEITPLMLLHQPAHAFGLTASPLHLRWNFAPVRARRLRAFAECSGGIVYTNQAVPARTTGFNFIDQAGFGVRVETRQKRAWLAGYRFQHISNAGRVKPNPGANFNLFYVGVTFLH